MRNENGKRIIEPGDKIRAKDNVTGCAVTLTVDKVISCDDYGEYDPVHPNYDWGFYCEFIAKETGHYGYWKQQYDGGNVIPCYENNAPTI